MSPGVELHCPWHSRMDPFPLSLRAAGFRALWVTWRGIPRGPLDRRLEFRKDTKQPNAGTFVLQREDHTVGNLVRCMLHRDEHVVFAGYRQDLPPSRPYAYMPSAPSSSLCAALGRIPHPLKHEMHVRVQTDGTQTIYQQRREAWTPIKVKKGCGSPPIGAAALPPPPQPPLDMTQAFRHALTNLEDEFESLRSQFENECHGKVQEVAQQRW